MNKKTKPFSIFVLLSFFPGCLNLSAPDPKTQAVDVSKHSSVAQASGKTFAFRLPAEPETLDWNRAHTPVETHILVNLMEGLMGLDSKLQLVPAIAESWKVSPDGMTYIFKLRSGVRWSDGVPLKAQDFVYSWKRLLSPDTAAAYAYLLYDVKGAEDFNQRRLLDFNRVGIRVLDDQTLTVNLVHPVSYWAYIPTFWVTFPLRQDLVEKYGAGWVSPEHMVTVGPYTLSEHKIDSKIVLKSNPNYYGSRGNVDRIVARIIRDDSTALNLYESSANRFGNLDFLTDIPSYDLERLEGRKDLVSFPYLKTVYLGFVTTPQALCDTCDQNQLRKSLAMAIDKTKFGMILHGNQVRASSFVPPSMMGFSEDAGLPYDPSRARKELEAAMKDSAREGGVGPHKSSSKTPAGLPKLSLLLLNFDRSLIVGQYIQNELKKNLGLSVTLEPFDNKTYRAKLDSHEFSLFLTSWSADYPDPDNFLSIFLSTSGNNRTLWRSAEFDAKINSAKYLRSTDEREKLYLQAQELLLNHSAAIMPLYYDKNIALVRPGVHGVALNPLNYLFIKNVMLEEK